VIELGTGRSLLLLRSADLPEAKLRPRRFSALAADGVTPLYGVMFFPSDFDEGRQYALVDYIYPGPSAAQQPQSLQSVSASLAVSLAELGLVSIMLNTRGTPVGSRHFHQQGYGGLLEPQLADHAAAVQQLCSRYPYLDRSRIGIIGWSGGGAAAARAIFDYGSIFKVCVSACGNHDSSAYASLWSDKYRGPNQCEAWPGQANSAAVSGLSGKLLLISGDMDENVHPSQTLRLVDALIGENKDFELLIVPNAGHDVLLASGYAQRRVWDFMVRNLLEEEPPTSFEVRFEPDELERFALRSWQEFGA